MSTHASLLAAAAALALPALAADVPAAPAATPAPASGAVSASAFGDLLPGWLQVGGQIRNRFEVPRGLGFDPAASDAYDFSRVRLDFLVRPVRQLRFYFQLNDSRAWGYDARSAIPGVHNPLDIRQGYVEYVSDEARGFSLRAGRQELTLGAGRLVASPDWSNVGRTYDLARAALYSPGVRVDLLAGSPVLADPGRLDRHRPGEHLYGSYGTLSRLVPGASIQPYFLAKTALGVAAERGARGDAGLYTAGLRWDGKLPRGFDYAVEVARQWGSWSSDRIAANAGTYSFGWTASRAPWKPRLSLDFHHASGDANAKDGTRGTFDQLYAGNHAFLGFTETSGWRNIRMPKAGVEVAPSRRVKLLADFRELYLATTQDGLYAGSRTILCRTATSRHAGSETDFQASYQISRFHTVTAGVGRLFAGAFLKQAGKPGDYTYPFLIWQTRF